LGTSWGARTTDQFSFVGRIGNPFFDYKKFEVVRRIAGVTTFGSWRRADALGLSPNATPTRSGSLTSGNVGVQGAYSAYVTPRDWLLELRSGLSGSLESRTPSVALPGAQVLVGSGAGVAATDSGHAVGLVPVAFGGNGAIENRRRTWLWENQASVAFYPPGQSRHQVALAGRIQQRTAWARSRT
jgi:hypothetical protein